MIARPSLQCDIGTMGKLERGSRSSGIIRIALVAVAVLVASIQASVAFAQTRVIAVGDLHGDYDAWTAIARASGLVDANGHWAAGRTTLVQLGDILDREPDSLKIVRSLQQLQLEAPRSGGHVFVVLGNHEAMNLLGDFRYTTPGEFVAFADPQSSARRDQYYASIKSTVEAATHAQNPALLPSQIREQWMADHPLGWIEHEKAWSPSGARGRWATNNPAIVKGRPDALCPRWTQRGIFQAVTRRNQPPRENRNGRRRQWTIDNPL